MAPAKTAKKVLGKSKSHKAESAGKIERKDIANDKRKELKMRREKLKAQLAKKKEELSKLKEDDPRYAELKAEIDVEGDTAMEYDKEIEALDEAADMDLDDEEEEQEQEDKDETNEELFVSASSGNKRSNPYYLEGNDGDIHTPLHIPANNGVKDRAKTPEVVDDDDEEEANILTRAMYNEKSGQDSDGKVVGWRRLGYGKQALVKYGPRNTALYKMVPISSAPDFDDTAVPCITDDRPGEEYDKKTRKWKYTQKDVVSLQGVAVHFDSEDPKNIGRTWLDYLNPESHNDKEKKRRFESAICLVKWSNHAPSWETRTTVRRLWSKQKGAGDSALYMVGQENQRRYDQWKSGQREAKDISPTPYPEIGNLKREDAESREGSPLSDSQTPPPTSGNPAGSSTPGPSKSGKRTEDEFNESWLRRRGLVMEELEPGQETAMITAYDDYLRAP